MQQLMVLSGNVAAILGVLSCTLAALFRLTGNYYVPGGVEAMSAFNLGVGLMVYGCLVKVELLLQARP